MPTIHDIADLAGVSVATVSRVLNHTGRVSDKTRDKINAIIKQTNYVPNQAARTLYQKRSGLIGVIIPDLNNPFYAEVVTAIDATLQQSGYRILLAVNTGANQMKYDASIAAFEQNNVDGIISSDFSITPTNTPTKPLVLFNSGLIDDHINRVVVDNYSGGQLAAKTLIKARAQKVVIQHGPLSLPPVRERFEGAIAALTQAHLDYEIQLVSDFTLAAARSAAEALFTTFHDFDAVIAANDIHALTIAQQAQANQIKIPQALQIVGFDGSLYAEVSQPSLTTVDQHASTVGTTAGEFIVDLIKHNSAATHPLRLVKPSVLLRASTMPQ